MNEIVWYSAGTDCKSAPAGQFKSVNGDAFEAFMGALFLDKGYATTYRILVKRVVEMHIDLEALQNNVINFKSKLIEWSQKEKKQLEFILLNEIGDGFNKQYEVVIRIDGTDYAKARDFSIKGAEQLAAEKTSSLIQQEYSMEE